MCMYTNKVFSTQQTQAGQVSTPLPPPLLEGDALYDFLMGQVEHELTTGILSTLSAKYRGETSEEQEIRRERYNRAFERYHELLDDYARNWKLQMHAFAASLRSFLEEESRTQEARQLDAIDASIANA